MDLGKQYSLCGVSTQGDGRYGFTKSYKIKLSSDRIQWKFYQNNSTDMVCNSNYWSYYQLLTIKDTNPTNPDLRYLSVYNLLTFTTMQRK